MNSALQLNELSVVNTGHAGTVLNSIEGQTKAFQPPKPRKYPKQTRSKILVQSIKETALMMLQDTPMAELKSTKIAEITGICMGSLYQYYPHTDAIVTTLYEDVILETAQQLGQRSQQLSSAKQHINELHSRLSEMDEQFNCNYYQSYYSSRLSVNFVISFKR